MEKKNQSKMRTGVLMGVVLLLIISLLVGACTKAPATPTPTKPGATPTPAAVKPIILKYASGGAKLLESSFVRHDVWYLEEIKKRSAALGKPIEIQEYFGGALGATTLELIEVVRSGQADMAKVCPTCGAEDWFRWESGINQIFLIVKTHEEQVRIVRTLFNEFPEFQEQWAGINARALTTQAVGTYSFISRMPLKTLAELKGKKFYTWGSYVPKLLNAAGAVPVSIAGSDVYDGIKTGLIDGRYNFWQNIVAPKFYEVATYWLMAETGTVRSTPNFINLKSYNSLPADLRGMLDQLSLESDDQYLRIIWEGDKRDFDFLKGRLTYARMSKEDNDAWIKAAGGVYGFLDDWVDNYMKKLGRQAKAKQIADRMKELSRASWDNPTSSWLSTSVPEWTLKSPVTGQVIGKPYKPGDDLPELFPK